VRAASRKDGWFSAIEYIVATFSFTLLVRTKMEKHQVYHRFSLRLRVSAVA